MSLDFTKLVRKIGSKNAITWKSVGLTAQGAVLLMKVAEDGTLVYDTPMRCNHEGYLVNGSGDPQEFPYFEEYPEIRTSYKNNGPKESSEFYPSIIEANEQVNGKRVSVTMLREELDDKKIAVRVHVSLISHIDFLAINPDEAGI